MWCIKKENILKDIRQLEDDTPKHQENSKVSVKNVQKKNKKAWHVDVARNRCSK